MARPKSENPAVKMTVSLSSDLAAYVGLYLPSSDNRSAQVQEALELLRKMRPSGPEGFGRQVKRSRHVVPGAKVSRWSPPKGAADDLTSKERVALIVQRYAEEHPEEFK